MDTTFESADFAKSALDRHKVTVRNSLHGLASLLALIFCVVFAHLRVLQVPYFWDETYFAPAARDMLLSGKLIPTSVSVESHPPLVYIWLAVWWKVFGFSIPVARAAMLSISIFALAGTYQLARLCTRGFVPIVTTALTAVYPVFFVHSTAIQLDMAAAAFVLWALVAHLRRWYWVTGVLFSLAALAKETAIAAPLGVLAAEIINALWSRSYNREALTRPLLRRTLALLLPILTLACWFLWLHHSSGTFFGGSQYARDNVSEAIHPLRMALSCLQHVWHLIGYLNFYVLTGLTAIICAIYRPLQASQQGYTSAQCCYPRFVIGAVVAVFVIEHSVVGYVVLARYLLPVYPLVVLVLVGAIASRVKWWPAVAGVTAVAFVAALFPYTNWFLFRRDDNLAYLDYVSLHQSADEFLARKKHVRIVTEWPASAELSNSWLGYTSQPWDVTSVDSFTQQDLMPAMKDPFDYILMFPRRTCKATNPLLEAPWWHVNYFRANADPQPEEVARLMNGRVAYFQRSHCDWVALVEVARTVSPPR